MALSELHGREVPRAGKSLGHDGLDVNVTLAVVVRVRAPHLEQQEAAAGRRVEAEAAPAVAALDVEVAQREEYLATHGPHRLLSRQLCSLCYLGQRLWPLLLLLLLG